MEHKWPYKLLAQVLAAAGITTLYTPGSNTNNIPLTTNINICNTSTVATYFSIGYCKVGETPGASQKQYIEKNLYIAWYSTSAPANNSYTISLDAGVVPGDILFIETPAATIAVNLFGNEN